MTRNTAQTVECLPGVQEAMVDHHHYINQVLWNRLRNPRFGRRQSGIRSPRPLLAK